MIPSIKHYGKGKTMQTIKRSVVARRGWWGGEMHRQSTKGF